MPRAQCPWCGRDVAIRAGGGMRQHFDEVPARSWTGRKVCPGSGHTRERLRQMVVRDRARAAGTTDQGPLA